MRRFTMSFVATAALLFALPSAAGAQALGQLFIEVFDESGEPVIDLRPGDFTIRENGQDVRVESAELDPVGREPMKVALLVHNGVMTGVESLTVGGGAVDQGGPVPGVTLNLGTSGDTGAVNQLRAGVVTFLETLPPSHEVGLFTIGGTIQRRVDFTTDRDELKEAAERIFVEQSPGVIMLDGVKETWERRYDDGDRFPVFVLVLTDGPEGSSSYSENDYVELMTDLVQNNVTIHVVLVSMGGSIVSQYALNMTQITGGTYQNLAIPRGLANALQEVATRMGEHYEQVSNRHHVIFRRADPPGDQFEVYVDREDVDVRVFADRRMAQ